MMRRRHFLGTLLLVPVSLGLEGGERGASQQRLRGRLEVPSEGMAGIRTDDGKRVALHGDEQTEKVLRDGRLQGWDFEVRGHLREDGCFEILPIHLAALFTYRDGKLLRVTYYCDVCAIRTFSPGICMCCRDETRVDTVDPEVVTGSK